MPMRDSDTILGAARGSADEVIAFARRTNAKRLNHVERYVREVYDLAPRIDVDPAIVVAQSALETNNWRDDKWSEKLNPAGMGVTDNFNHGFGWPNGESAARGQIVHLWLYAKGRTLPDALEPFRHLDPRRDAIPVAQLGKARTLHALGGRWASVEDYGQRIVNRSRSVYPNLPDQRPVGPDPTPGPTPSPTPSPTPTSEPGIAWKRERFGRMTVRRIIDGREQEFLVAYNPEGQVSRLWERRGGEEGEWPAFAHYRQFEARREFWAFEDGFTVWRPNSAEAVRPLIATAGGDVEGIDAGWKRERFGEQRITRTVAGQPQTTTVRFSADDPLSRLWEARAAATGLWPGFAEFQEGADGREFWTFGGGFTTSRSTSDTPLRALKAEAGDEVAGIDQEWKRQRFGGKTVFRIIDGQQQELVIAYNPEGQVSRLWERRGAKEGTWPRFAVYLQDEELQEFWTFVDGFTVWRPRSAEPVRPLTTGA